ncbi:MAG: 50S ribosomal protein L9 [Patescibacteria group bacterium]|jgi:large subunit ribosomal protein L9
MNIVLLQDVKGVGTVGAVVNVAEGYARNFLLPRKLGALASGAAVTKAKQSMAGRGSAVKAQEALVTSLRRLDEVTVQFARSASASGTLFAGVSAEDIVEGIRKQYSKLRIPVTAVHLPHALKQVGTHYVVIGASDAEARVRILITAT